MTAWHTPAHPPALGTGELQVWKASIAELAPLEPAFTTLLDQREQQRAARFLPEAARLRYSVSHGMLRTLAGHHLGVAPESVRFSAGQHGKPHVAGPDHDRLRFNLSHSGDIVLIAMARRGNVGVDVEAWSERLAVAAVDRITQSVFSALECAALKQIAPERRCAAFYAVWSRKEAYIKATGLGISQGLAHFDVSSDPGEAVLLADRIGDAGGWAMHDLNVGPGYSAALAVDEISLAVVPLHATADLL